MVAFLAVVAPGFLTIYHYHPELVKELDVIKLVVFSASLSCPLIFCNMLLLVVGAGDNFATPKKGEALLLACLSSAPSFYVALALAWYFHMPFSRLVLILLFPAGVIGFAIVTDKPKIKEPSPPKPNEA